MQACAYHLLCAELGRGFGSSCDHIWPSDKAAMQIFPQTLQPARCDRMGLGVVRSNFFSDGQRVGHL